MDNFLKNRGRPREPVWPTFGEVLVLFWLCLRAEMVRVFELRWWWTPMANEHLILRPCLLERRSWM